MNITDVALITNQKEYVINRPGFYLYKDMHNRYWQLIPVTNPAIVMPFLIKPLSFERFNQLKEEYK